MCLLVNKFLCCISLDVGAKVIGIWSTMTSIAIAMLYGTSGVMLPSLPQSRLVFYWTMAGAALLQLVFSCLLTYGAFKNKARFMWPWTMLTWCEAVLLMVLSVAGMVLLACHSDTADAAEFGTVISVYFVYAVLQYYLASTVHSRRQELLREDHSDSAKRLMRTQTLPNRYV